MATKHNRADDQTIHGTVDTNKQMMATFPQLKLPLSSGSMLAYMRYITQQTEQVTSRFSPIGPPSGQDILFQGLTEASMLPELNREELGHK